MRTNRVKITALSLTALVAVASVLLSLPGPKFVHGENWVFDEHRV